MALSVSGFPEHASRHVQSQSQSQNALSPPSSSSSSSGIDPESSPASSLMNSPRLRGLFGKKPQHQAGVAGQENTGTDVQATGSSPLPPPPPTTTAQEYDYDLQIQMPIPIPLPPLGQPPRPKRPQPIPIPRQSTASPVRLQPSLARLEIGRTVPQGLGGVKGEAGNGRASILPSEGGMKAVGAPSRSPPPPKIGSTYHHHHQHQQQQQQQAHQRTPSSKVLLTAPSPPRNPSSSSSSTAAAKMRYQPLVVDPPSPVPSFAASASSTSSTASPALSSSTLSSDPSSSSTSSSPIIRSLPPTPLRSAPLVSTSTSTNTNTNTNTNTRRPYVPPPVKVKRPRTSPGSISHFAPAAGTGRTPRTPKSSMSKASSRGGGGGGGGMPISYSWASRPVDLNPCGSPRITTTTTTTQTQTQAKMMTMRRRRDHSADSFLVRAAVGGGNGVRQTPVGRAQRPRSISVRRTRVRSSGEPSPLRSSITFGSGSGPLSVDDGAVPLGDPPLVPLRDSSSSSLPPPPPAILGDLGGQLRIRPQPHITTSWMSQSNSGSLESSPAGSPTPTSTASSATSGQGREQRPVLTLSAVGVGSAFTSTSWSTTTRPGRSATLPSSSLPSPSGGGGMMATPTLSVQTTPTRLTSSVQSTPTTLVSNATDSLRTWDFPSPSADTSSVGASTSASTPMFTNPFPSPAPSSSSSPPSSSSSPPFSYSSSPQQFMHPFPSTYHTTTTGGTHTCTDEGGEEDSLSTPTSPIEFFVDDDGTLSGCGGEYYGSSSLGSEGSFSASPSPIRYARPREVGWDDDDDGFSEGEVAGEHADISILTDDNDDFPPSSPMGYDPPSPMAYAPPSPADDLTVSPISVRGRRRKGLPRSYRVDYSAPGSPGIGFEFLVAGRRGGSLERSQREHVKGPTSGREEEEEEDLERGRKARARVPLAIPGGGRAAHAMMSIPDRKPIPIPKRKFADAVSMAFFEDGRLMGRRKRGKSVGAGAGGGVGVEAGEHAFVLDISLEGEAGVGSSSSGGKEEEEEEGVWGKKNKGKALLVGKRGRTESASGSSDFSLDDDDDAEGREKTGSTPFMWVSRSQPAARYQGAPIIPIPVPPSKHQHHAFVTGDEEEWEGEVPNNLSCGLTLLAGPSSPPLGKKGRGRTKSAGSVQLSAFGF